MERLLDVGIVVVIVLMVLMFLVFILILPYYYGTGGYVENEDIGSDNVDIRSDNEREYSNEQEIEEEGKKDKKQKKNIVGGYIWRRAMGLPF